VDGETNSTTKSGYRPSLVPHHPTLARLGSVYIAHKEKVGTLEAWFAFGGFGFHILLNLFGLFDAVVEEHTPTTEVVVGFAEVIADEFVEECDADDMPIRFHSVSVS
jgi:hypothetical protein